jgi:CheY-like chemotaxis protein
MAGTERNLALAEYVRDRFREYGVDEVSFHEFPALLSFPKSAALSIKSPVDEALQLNEDPNPADKDSKLYDDPAQVAFHGYAPSGKVRAEVVYANGGSPEDFQQLDRMGIDLKGKVVLMRYSNPYSYRGYKVYEAGNAEEALEWTRTSGVRADLLVTDIVMPGLAGPDLARRLTEADPSLRVLFISGYTEAADEAQGAYLGGVPFLQKPFTAGKLAERVRVVLDTPRGPS